MATQPRYFQGTTLLLFTVAVAMANLMEVLDITIANVSIPTIAGDLGVSANQGTWIITSYAVANAITVPLTGFLAQRFGQVRVFATAMALFTAASLLCGFATSFPELLAFRVIQGAVAGFMVPLSQALLLGNYPPEKRGMALATWVMTITVAPIVGPILGGWITDNYHWSWIFLINVPVGIVATAVTWGLLKNRETPTQKQPIDVVGATLLVIWVGALQIMLDKGNELDWFHSDFIVSLALVALIGFAVFLAWELTDPHPIVDLSLIWQYRNFRMGALALSLAYAVFFASIVVLPLWLQTQMNYTAQWAGFALAPSGVLAVILSPLVGRRLQQTDPRLFASVAFVVFAIVSFWRAQFTANADFATIALPQLLQGIAIATLFAPLVSINLGGIPPTRVANASGLQNFLRMMAGSFGTSLAVTLWDRRATQHRTYLTDHVNTYSLPTGDYLHQLTGLGATPDQAYAQMERVLTVQIYTLATNDIFWLAGWLFLALILVVWTTRPPFGAPGAMH